MKNAYAAIAGYALLASGCVGPQCLPDCAARTSRLETETATCYRLLESDFPQNSPRHQEFSRHFKNAAENALGAPAIVDSQFFELDPDHFEDHRKKVLGLYADAIEQHPWIENAQTIPYELTAQKPPYDQYTKFVSPHAIADTLRTTIPPRRKTTLGEILDALDGVFGWLLTERPH